MIHMNKDCCIKKWVNEDGACGRGRHMKTQDKVVKADHEILNLTKKIKSNQTDW